MVDIALKLVEIGFSEYEAKTYIALISENPLTPYEIAKSSSIPTSKIYEVIGKLIDKGIISAIEENQKRKYTPLPPGELLDSYKTKMEKTINDLKMDLIKVKQDRELSYIWNINEYEYLLNKAIRMIENSKKTLLISIWPDELNIIRPFLEKAEISNIKIAIILFGKTSLKLGTIFQHPIEDTIYNEKGGRGLAVVSDSSEVLIGTIYEENKKVEGALSQNKGFVTMTEDYIKHDIYIMKVVKRFDKQLINLFGENYKKLRDIFKDEEEIQ